MKVWRTKYKNNNDLDLWSCKHYCTIYNLINLQTLNENDLETDLRIKPLVLKTSKPWGTMISERVKQWNVPFLIGIRWLLFHHWSRIESITIIFWRHPFASFAFWFRLHRWGQHLQMEFHPGILENDENNLRVYFYFSDNPRLK